MRKRNSTKDTLLHRVRSSDWKSYAATRFTQRVNRKTWLVLGAFVGVLFLGTIGTLLVDNWRKSPPINVSPKTAEDLRTVDLVSLVSPSNDLPLERAGLVVIEDTRWVATAEAIRSLADYTGNDMLNLYKVHLAKPSEPRTAKGMIAVGIYASVLSAQNKYQTMVQLLKKYEKMPQSLDVSDVGEQAYAYTADSGNTFFEFLRCHATVGINVPASISPDAVLAYGKRLDEQLRVATCP